MQALITGASGFVGSHLARRLLAEGKAVRLFVRDRERLPSGLQDTALVEGDLKDPYALAQAVDGVEVVYHCAANVQTWDTTRHYEAANVIGVRNLLEAIGRHNPDLHRLVHLSTVDVYGYPIQPCDESCPLDGGGFGYGESKLAGERLVRDSDLPWTVLRPTNIYGPGSPFVWRIGDALRDSLMLTIDGGRANAGLLHIDNLVTWMRWAAEASEALGQCFNVRDTDDVDWATYLDALKTGIDGRGRVINLPFRAADAIAHTLAVFHRAVLPRREPLLHPLLVRMFGRTCGHSAEKLRQVSCIRGAVRFEEGMAQSVEWYRNAR
jgi:nucleoside-diphosphate-sugar epimerase